MAHFTESVGEETALAWMDGNGYRVVGGLQWHRHYNAVRPHSSLGYRPPAPEAIAPRLEAMAAGALT